jgi:hypothetical protein
VPRVLRNFQHYGNTWTVHFYNFATFDALRSFVTSCQPEEATLAGFDHSVRAWGRGSEYVHLTPEQHANV